MRRFFYAILIICVLSSLCGCVNDAANSIKVNSENNLFFGYGRDFFVVVRQSAEGQFSIDNRSYRYNYLKYSVQLYPTNIHTEGKKVEVNFQDNDIEFSDGNYYMEADGVAESDVITLSYGDIEEEIYLEEITVDCEKILNDFLFSSELCEINIGYGSAEIKFILDYRGVYVFCGYSENECLKCAALYDTDGEQLTIIGS